MDLIINQIVANESNGNIGISMVFIIFYFLILIFNRMVQVDQGTHQLVTIW